MIDGDARSVNFLDTTVFHDSEHKLWVKPYVKPTDYNTYLHYNSFHTRHLRNNILYGQFLRLKRNATDNDDFRRNAQRLRGQFLQRGYPPDIVVDAETRATLCPRDSLFVRSRSANNRLYWALDHSPRSTQIVKKDWHLI